MTQTPLTPGKYSALVRSSTPAGTFAILALDHIDGLRRSIAPDAPMSVSEQALIDTKAQIVSALLPNVSGALLDPKYGAPQMLARGEARCAGLLVELENNDYQMNPLPMQIDIPAGWSVEKIKRMGADGVKLFFYYHPDERTHAQGQLEVVRRTAEACRIADIPLFAEPIMYQPIGVADAAYQADRTRIVVASAQHTAQAGADVLKLEFPGDPQTTHMDEWIDACRQVSAAIAQPWVLLSAGVGYKTFCSQVEAACKGGASGFIAGRAVWREAAAIQHTDQRLAWLESTGRQRTRVLADVARRYASTWTQHYTMQDTPPDWYTSYDLA